MHCSTGIPRRRLPNVVASIVLLAASGGFAAQAQAANQPPVISGSPAATVQLGSPYFFQPNASDPDGQTLRFSIVNKPWWAGFSASTGRLSGTPKVAGRWGNIQIRVSDGASSRALAAFSITAGAGASEPGSGASGNQAPVISGSPATSVQVKSAYSFQPSASDPEGGALSFSIVNKPWWASFSKSTGRLAGTPGVAGRWGNIQIRVSDGKLSRSLPAFAITASAASANKPPVISGSPASAVTVGQAYSFKPSASDPEGNALGFSINNRPSWASFSTSTGQLSGSPTSSHVGAYTNIVISVSDGKASASLPAFSIAVNAPANTAPVIGGSPASSVNAGSGYSFRPSASDANGDTLSFSIANRPTWATFSSSTGQLSGTPGAAHVGTYSNIVISVSDGKAKTSLKAFSITVADVSIGGATLSWTPPTQNTDGSSLSNLAGYRIHYGTSSSMLTHSIQVSNPGVTNYVIENLSPGTYYFAVTAFTSNGAESDKSNIASKAVR